MLARKEKEIIEYIQYINEAEFTNAHLQGFVKVTDPSGKYPSISAWVGSWEQSALIEKPSGNWKCNMKFIHKVYLHAIRIHQCIEEDWHTYSANNVTWKYKDSEGKWITTAKVQNWRGIS